MLMYLLCGKHISTPDEERYVYEKKQIYDQLFRFMVTFPFGDLHLQGEKETYALDSLQESMQALKTAKDANKSLLKIVKTEDLQTKTYWGQIITYLDELYNLIQEWNYSLAHEKIVSLRWWDEQQMKVIIDARKEVSADLAELFQIHDHIHQVVASLLESKELFDKMEN